MYKLPFALAIEVTHALPGTYWQVFRKDWIIADPRNTVAGLGKMLLALFAMINTWLR